MRAVELISDIVCMCVMLIITDMRHLQCFPYHYNQGKHGPTFIPEILLTLYKCPSYSDRTFLKQSKMWETTTVTSHHR